MVQHKWYPVTMEVKRGAAKNRAKKIRESEIHTLSQEKVVFSMFIFSSVIALKAKKSLAMMGTWSQSIGFYGFKEAQRFHR